VWWRASTRRRTRASPTSSAARRRRTARASRLEVNGKRLKPGRYQLTLRVIGKQHRILGTTKAVTIRVRR
jgi:hypothetical protein